MARTAAEGESKVQLDPKAGCAAFVSEDEVATLEDEASEAESGLTSCSTGMK